MRKPVCRKIAGYDEQIKSLLAPRTNAPKGKAHEIVQSLRAFSCANLAAKVRTKPHGKASAVARPVVYAAASSAARPGCRFIDLFLVTSLVVAVAEQSQISLIPSWKR